MGNYIAMYMDYLRNEEGKNEEEIKIDVANNFNKRIHDLYRKNLDLEYEILELKSKFNTYKYLVYAVMGYTLGSIFSTILRLCH